MMEAELLPGAGPPRHVHDWEDETFLLLAGEITFFSGDQAKLLNKGDFIYAPRHIPHCFKNSGTETVVLLETSSPAGIEHFFRSAGRPLVSRDEQPYPMSPEEVQPFKSKAPEFGITLLGPH